MDNRPKFTADNVFVVSDPYLKLMDGETDKCVGYMPKESTDNLFEIVGVMAKAGEANWVRSWFDAEKGRHFISLSWQDVKEREAFAKAFGEVPEAERRGVVRDAECEALDGKIAEDMNGKREKAEAGRRARREAWFAEEANAEAVKRVSMINATVVRDENTGAMRGDPEEVQFIENIIRFMSKTDQPDVREFLGHDDEGRFWIAYGFRLETLKKEFERRVNCNEKKPEGISLAHEGEMWEELVMGVVKKNAGKKALEASESAVDAGGCSDTAEAAEAAEEAPDAVLDPTEEFQAADAAEGDAGKAE